MNIDEKVEQELKKLGYRKVNNKDNIQNITTENVYVHHASYTDIYGNDKAWTLYLIKTPNKTVRLDCSGFYCKGGSVQDKILYKYLSALFCYNEDSIITLDGNGYPTYVKDWIKEKIETKWLYNKYAKNNTIMYKTLDDLFKYLEEIRG